MGPVVHLRFNVKGFAKGPRRAACRRAAIASHRCNQICVFVRAGLNAQGHCGSVAASGWQTGPTGGVANRVL